MVEELNEAPQEPFEPIAIVGMSALLPDAPDLDSFWQNVLSAHVSIKDVPAERWNAGDFYVAGEPGSAPEGKTYSRIGAFVEGFEFDWRRWRQPPGSLSQIDDSQLWAVEVAAAALEHAGYLGEGARAELPNERTGVVFANALGGEQREYSNHRIFADQLARKAVESGMPADRVDSFKEAVVEGTPRVDEDTMPGELANVVAGRVSNLLDLQGPNFTADAACASTFAALVTACRLLQTGQVDVMLAGASDRTMDPATYAKFSAIGALSPTHSRPFDARANGFVMGEGAGCVVLKRLDDAIADGDSIYSVIRGIGASSDGRGKGITAPSTRGQKQAVMRALQQAGYSAESIELIEAHGTSTKVGDATELDTLSGVFSSAGAGDRVAVGSIKSQIGHLKAAAGMAGLLKASLALHHRTLPPSAGFEQPNTSVEWGEIPFYVPTIAAEWPSPPSGLPRRAGISAFGFGGTNFHCTIEQYDPEYHLALANSWNSEESSGEGSPPSCASVLDPSAEPSLTWEELKSVEGGILLLNANDLEALEGEIALSKAALFAPAGPTFDDNPEGRRLSAALNALSSDYSPVGVRCAVVASSWAQLEKRLDLLLSNLGDRSRWDFLSKQMVFITDQRPLPENAALVQMFPGQGSQYVGMTCDLSKRYEVVGETWREADRTMVEILEGEKLSDFVLRENLTEEEGRQAEEKLKQTEYTQPAMLTADLAIHRLLASHGIHADMVAGHSLGEYAALSVSGILKFHDALRAAAARGTEMGSVDVPDQGLMASVTAPFEAVIGVIESVDGYVIAANKNCPSMTVIAGETAPMQEAIRRFAELGIQCVVLQTSHAFHSRIVAPANEPLRRFLEGLELSLPKIPITANYDGKFYPTSLHAGQTTHDAILAQLAPQMSSAVEWTEQIKTMYDAGGRLFVEVGPKRALAIFADQILADSPKVVTNTNHPKQGGVASFHGALAVCALAGRVAEIPAYDSTTLTEGFRAGPLEVWRGGRGGGGSRVGAGGHSQGGTLLPLEPSISSSDWEELRVRARPLPSGGVNAASSNSLPASSGMSAPGSPSATSHQIVEEVADIEGYLASCISAVCGYPERLVRGELELASLGVSGDSLTTLLSRISSEATVNGPIDAATLGTLPALVEWVSAPPEGFTIQVKRQVVSTANSAAQLGTSGQQDPMAARRANPYVVTGISLGLPGMDEVFAPDALERIVNGENFISELPQEVKQRLLDKNLVRIVKKPDGGAEFVPCDSFDLIPQLAGVGGYFDLAEQYGIDAKIVAAMDASTTLSFAAGLEALKDAGLPLVAVEQTSSKGKRLIRAWHLPDTIRDRTGVVFSSVFPGIGMAMRHALNNGADEDGTFDRKFLLQILTMGHAQFAQWIGARGPNAAINNACASTPAAFAIAEDWISTGRCDRVIVISGDDSTGDDLMEWIGAGFAAAGAHSMGNVIEEVAVPFDARRNGMLLGMGGAAFVIERASHASERGVIPYAELLGAHLGNSAYHPTRLDVEHVADSLDQFVGRMESEWGLDRHEVAPLLTFMSHEPYTPARGGSASAEIQALRTAFGDSADEIIISNTKGFTGHPMGVGIEDATALHGLAIGRLPPIANFKEPDPELGNLRLSKGGEYEFDYVLRHAAGFGSQMALTFFRKIATGLDRIHRDRVESWTNAQVGDSTELRLLERKLVAYISPDDSLIGGVVGDEWKVTEPTSRPATAPKLEANPAADQTPTPSPNPKPEPTSSPSPKPSSSPSPEPAPTPGTSEQPVGDDELSAAVIETVAKHTGYPIDFIELDQDLEGELGIDTVKQAEIMADLRENFSLPVDDSFQLRDHPTLNHMISYIQSMSGGVVAAGVAVASAASLDKLTPALARQEAPDLESNGGGEAALVVANSQTASSPDVESGVIAIVVRHTGYPEDFLELDQDLEGELGIDTVKQAEIMADCRETFGLPVDDSFQLRDYPTLSHMIAYVHSMGGSSNSADTLPTPGPEPTSDDNSDGDADANSNSDDNSNSNSEPIVAPSEPEVSTVRRWQVEVEEAESGPRHPLGLAGSHVIVTDDSWGVAEAICSRLEEAGIDAVRLMLDPSVVTKVKVENKDGVDIIRMDPGNEDHLSQLEERLAQFDISGIIHVAPCTLAGMAWAEVTSQQQTQMVCHGLFGVLRAVDSMLAARESGLVCSVSALDGRHGTGGHRFNPLGAGAHGIVKSYSREQPHLRSRALDVAPELLAEPELLADAILSEIEQPGPKEVGLDSDGRRWTLCIYDESLDGERQPLASDDVYLVSGGGSGVTASCIMGLAIANRDVGAHFALLGRTKLEDPLVKFAGASEAELKERKVDLRVEMQKQSDSGKVTIVEWESEWGRMRRSIDVHQTIAIINSTGNTASYHQCDVTRGKQIRRVLKKLKKKRGPITGIVHGAGIEDSKLVADKEWQTFENVFSVKVDGWQAMVNAANDHGSDLRFCCAFTSIAGRFGNAGQVDYAAANSILDAEMARIAHTPGRQRAVALAWTGWRDVGMATRGSIEGVFEQAGIETVPVDLGVELFVDEVMRGGKRRVVIAGALGVLDEEESSRDPPQRLSADVALLIEEPNRFPFVDRITSHEPYEELSYECTLDVDRFPFLEDHAIDNVPYHPGVMAMEMFAEAAQLLWPPCSVIGFEKVEFGLPVKLMGDEQKVRVRAEFDRQDDSSIWVKCSLESNLVNKSGEVFGEPRLHHQGIVRLLKQGADRGLRRLPSIGAPSSADISYQPSFIYSRFFHGPRFQSHGGILRGCRMDDSFGADGIALMRHQLPNPEQFDGEPVELESMPMLIEACFQNAGMVAMEVDRLQSLPVGIEQVELIRLPSGEDNLRMRSVRRGAEDGGITVHDCIVIDGSGRPVIALNGLRLKGMAPIEESNWFVLNRN